MKKYFLCLFAFFFGCSHMEVRPLAAYVVLNRSDNFIHVAIEPEATEPDVMQLALSLSEKYRLVEIWDSPEGYRAFTNGLLTGKMPKQNHCVVSVVNGKVKWRKS